MKNNKSVTNWKIKFFQSMKEQVIAHLRGISNQEASVPIPGVCNDLFVKDIIVEVEKETLTGVKYMIEWSKITALIKEAKSEKPKEDFIPSDPPCQTC
jgi:hypothetical protein